jgi:hypothetical protein
MGCRASSITLCNVLQYVSHAVALLMCCYVCINVNVLCVCVCISIIIIIDVY